MSHYPLPLRLSEARKKKAKTCRVMLSENPILKTHCLISLNRNCVKHNQSLTLWRTSKHQMCLVDGKEKKEQEKKSKFPLNILLSWLGTTDAKFLWASSRRKKMLWDQNLCLHSFFIYVPLGSFWKLMKNWKKEFPFRNKFACIIDVFFSSFFSAK